jgi:hypothetical protein
LTRIKGRAVFFRISRFNPFTIDFLIDSVILSANMYEQLAKYWRKVTPLTAVEFEVCKTFFIPKKK